MAYVAAWRIESVMAAYNGMAATAGGSWRSAGGCRHGGLALK